MGWEQRSGTKGQPQQNAQKLSAVRRGPNEPPFQQQQQPQQQQQGEGSGTRGKRNRQGNRSGRPRAQQAQPIQQQEPPPSAPPQPFQFGHIASPIFHSPRAQVAPWYPPPAPQPIYPSFTSAHNWPNDLESSPPSKPSNISRPLR